MASSILVEDELHDFVKDYFIKKFLNKFQGARLEQLFLDKPNFDQVSEECRLFMTHDEAAAWCSKNPHKVLGILNHLDIVKLEASRGDLIETISDKNRYRNDGTFIYDGKKVVELDYLHSDYGRPPKYLIQEFGDDYWDGVLSYF